MAKKPIPIFDTSIFSDYADQIDKNILSMLFPTVVLYELVATSINETSLQKYERWRNFLSKNNRLLNPTATDWWETSKAIRRLYMMKARRQANSNQLETMR